MPRRFVRHAEACGEQLVCIGGRQEFGLGRLPKINSFRFTLLLLFFRAREHRADDQPVHDQRYTDEKRDHTRDPDAAEDLFVAGRVLPAQDDPLH